MHLAPHPWGDSDVARFRCLATGGHINTSAAEGWSIKAVRFCNFPDFTLISLCVCYHVIAVILQVEGEDCNNTKSIIFDWCVTSQTSV